MDEQRRRARARRNLEESKKPRELREEPTEPDHKDRAYGERGIRRLIDRPRVNR